jgi:hypothetical protein
MNNLCYTEKLIALFQFSISYFEKRKIRALYWTAFYFSMAIILTNCIGLNGPKYISQSTYNYTINKAGDFDLRLDKITKATYGIISITFYGHPLNSQKGTIIISSGVGYVLDIFQKPVLATAYHVLHTGDINDREIFGYSIRFEKIANRSFLLSNKNEIFLVIKTLKEYLIENDGGGGIVDKSVYDGLFDDLKAEFSQSWHIPDVNLTAHRDTGIVFVAITDANSIDSIPFDYIEEHPEIRLGKQVAVYGCPNSTGAHYREGVISRTDSYNFIKNDYFPYGYHTDIILADGDSGAPIISTSNDGKLRIFGMVLAAMPNQPRLGKVLSSQYIRKILNTEDLGEKW